MDSQSKIVVIIPCYNEEASIENVVNNLLQIKNSAGLPIDILVVNDCSTDNTLKVLEKLECSFLDLPVNLGIGGAMHSGYKYAYRNQYTIAVQMDGDGQHPAIELPKILAPLIAGEADVVIGSRFIQQQGFQSTSLRRIGIQYFKHLNKFLIGKTIFDSTSGFRAFNTKAITIVNTYYPDEYPEPEAIVLFSLNKLKIMEVPVIMNERQGGVSSIRTWKTIYYMLKVTLGCFFSYLRFKVT